MPQRSALDVRRIDHDSLHDLFGSGNATKPSAKELAEMMVEADLELLS